MIKNENFELTLNISVDGYKDKKEATDCLTLKGAKQYNKKTLAWLEKKISLNDFIGYISSGHSFTGLYNLAFGDLRDDKYGVSRDTFYTKPKDYRFGALKNQFKTNENWKSSQVCWIDVDDTNFTEYSELIDKLQHKPTLLYSTFSDGIEKGGKKSRRFRLVYVFDTQLNEETWKAVSESLLEEYTNCTGEEADVCTTRIAQLMNGSSNPDIYNSSFIYSIFDFGYYKFLPGFKEEKTTIDLLKENTSLSEEYKLDENLVNDINTLDYSSFMKKYSRVYGLIYRTEKEEWKNYGIYQYQETDDDFLSLWWFKEKLKDGEHRRQTILNRAFQMRIIKPEASINEILFNLVREREWFYDNSDGQLGTSVLVNRAKLVFKKDDLEKNLKEQNRWIQRCKKERPDFIVRVNKDFKIGNTVPQNIINEIGKIIRWEKIGNYINPNLSVKENLEILKNNGIEVCEKTIYNYLKENNMNTKEEKIELFKKMYNPELSSRENAKIMTENGLEINYKTVQRWASKIESDHTVENNGSDDKDKRIKELEEKIKELEEKLEKYEPKQSTEIKDSAIDFSYFMQQLPKLNLE